MTIFCMAGILTVNPAIIGLAEEESAVGQRFRKLQSREKNQRLMRIPHRRINTRLNIMTEINLALALIKQHLK